ncbi:hypothetical protein CF645_37755, partial [Burkholderia pseudomallei]
MTANFLPAAVVAPAAALVVAPVLPVRGRPPGGGLERLGAPIADAKGAHAHAAARRARALRAGLRERG